ncbi:MULTISPECIES: TrkH family potassium uptake protein [Nitrosomonas]|uniref:Trk system potassium uptake protein n=1 Tax=Nitrosomonas communis TaxID=44574 RepID=A0A0F7KHL4_9PROT|nr:MULTISPECIES: potassium transporter TrkG [Nitrosomonas]AKH38352.1 potassium transporter Trk [Nitrosomonas communis]TYP90092.1 trk system potassium uptake protein TrkH [Nitrosomonas communis]UVS60354.1 TrkH family potassium uptake protein [Nitrosomonas sp. PLL12]
MNQFLSVTNVLSKIILVFGFTMLVPYGVAYWSEDGSSVVFGEAILMTMSCGAIIGLMTRRYKRELQIRDGFLLVVLVWLLLPLFGMLPLLRFFPDISFAKAYYEATSGLTASGGTVLTGLDILPHSINLWRGEMVWLGGMGLIVLAVAILPMLGVGGRQIFKAEIPGPMKESKLTPRIAETAKGLWLVYVLLTLICMIAYKLAGMNWFDAVMHAFTTLGLGGFSSHDGSYGYWNSPIIELVAIIFMMISGINFATHFMVWRAKSFSSYYHDPEIKPYFVIVLASCIGLAGYLWLTGVYTDPLTALRYASFNVVSVATTTGYSNTDYSLWPIFAPLWMLFLSGFCTSSGSTGGGIKMIRVRILYQQFFRELITIMHPQAISPVKLGKNVVANRIIFAVFVFLFVYLASMILLTLVLTLSGLDEITAFSAAVANINNLGPGLNQIGPATTYASLTDFQISLCSFAMLLGRLEFYTFLIVFTAAFWKK